jgi:hypothetical protein
MDYSKIAGPVGCTHTDGYGSCDDCLRAADTGETAEELARACDALHDTVTDGCHSYPVSRAG